MVIGSHGLTKTGFSLVEVFSVEVAVTVHVEVTAAERSEEVDQQALLLE